MLVVQESAASRPIQIIILKFSDRSFNNIAIVKIYHRRKYAKSIYYQDDSYQVSIFNDKCFGWKLDAEKPRNMTSLFGVTICGKRGGQNFLETVRISPITGQKCPEGLLACIDDENQIETSCVDDLVQCPIIDIKLVEDANFVQSEKYQLLEPILNGLTTNKLAFSKTVS